MMCAARTAESEPLSSTFESFTYGRSDYAHLRLVMGVTRTLPHFGAANLATWLKILFPESMKTEVYFAEAVKRKRLTDSLRSPLFKATRKIDSTTHDCTDITFEGSIHRHLDKVQFTEAQKTLHLEPFICGIWSFEVDRIALYIHRADFLDALLSRDNLNCGTFSIIWHAKTDDGLHCEFELRTAIQVNTFLTFDAEKEAADFITFIQHTVATVTGNEKIKAHIEEHTTTSRSSADLSSPAASYSAAANHGNKVTPSSEASLDHFSSMVP